MKRKFCPKCGNTKIEDITHSALVGDTRTLKCLKCNFTSKIFPEAEEKNLKKIKKEISSKHNLKSKDIE